jgi:hypothetical protein
MVKTAGFHQVMWLVMFESAKDQTLGVNTPGQHMPPCVRYGMACLLIRDVVGSAPCSYVWEVACSFAQAHWESECSEDPSYPRPAAS